MPAIVEVAASKLLAKTQLGTRKEWDFRSKLGEQLGIGRIQEEGEVVKRKHNRRTSLE
jgi:hypothetical protein